MKPICYQIIIGSLILFPLTERAQTSSSLSVRDVSTLEWKLWGYRPDVWRMNFNFESLTGTWAEIRGINAEVPGSVRHALKNAGIWGKIINYETK